MSDAYDTRTIAFGRRADEPEPAPAKPSVRAPFVADLHSLALPEVRARLSEIKAAVSARMDEVRDHDVRLALMMASDKAGKDLLHAARDAVEALANALAVSHGEISLPSAHPERRVRR